MVTMRSPRSIICDMALSRVVLPEPVPPEISTLSRARDAMRSTAAICGDRLAVFSIVSRVIFLVENLRIEMLGPSIASGGMMMLTRLPSARRASTSGVVSSTRLPTAETIREAMFMTWRLSRKTTPEISSLPLRST